MHRFKDNADREWDISLNGWQLKKLKETIDFDARDHESILKAANDPLLLCNVLFVLCEKQAKERGVSDEQFGEALGGDAIDAATEAYIQESVDFFPRSQRPALNKVLATVKDYQTRATDLATEKLNSPAMANLVEASLTEANQRIDRLLAGTTTGDSSGKPQGQPA
jgi:hypothetical protein